MLKINILKTNLVLVLVMLIGLGLTLTFSFTTTFAQTAYASKEQAILNIDSVLNEQAILTVVLRDSHGTPLQGVLCEVLSYDWGLEVGQPFAVIAAGETDQNGVVAFNVTDWPHSGYRFKFSPTERTEPNDTYFMLEERNQYRGYPAALVGGQTEKQFFVIGSDGLGYNDTAPDGKGPPQYKKDDIAGGIERSRITIIPSQDYLATVRAATATAQASGMATPTRPPRPAPSPRPGEVQSALTLTPVVSPPADVATSTSATQSGASSANPVLTALAGLPAPTRASSDLAKASRNSPATETNQPDLLESMLLAVFGVVSFGLFWKFRKQLYPWLGLEISPAKSKTRTNARANASRKSNKATSSTSTETEVEAEAEKEKYKPEVEPEVEGES